MPRTLDEVLRDLLDERVADPGIPILATEALYFPVRKTATRVFDLLTDEAPSVVRERVPGLLAELSRRSDRWDRVVRRSLHTKGRCPPGTRSALRRALAAAEPPAVSVPEFEESTHAGRRPQAAKLRVARRQIAMSTKASSIDGTSALLRGLAELGAPTRVQLDLTGCDHLYVVGLAVLATWARAHKVQLEVVGATRETSRYLDEIGFVDALESRRHPVGGRDAGRRVALEPIEQGVFADDLASRIVRILDDHGLVAASNRNALVICFAELIENVARHAGPGAVGFVGAEYYPQRRCVTVAVSDAGMGVKRSFLDGRNAEMRRRIQQGEDPLRLAVLPLVTSKPVSAEHTTGHAGYGLFLASEIAVRNGGTFRITSDTRSLTLFQSRGGTRRMEPAEHANWRGTIVSLLLHLDNVVSIRDVYRMLPQPEGFAAEDFFT